jgi:hypothetical protein
MRSPIVSSIELERRTNLNTPLLDELTDMTPSKPVPRFVLIDAE